MPCDKFQGNYVLTLYHLQDILNNFKFYLPHVLAPYWDEMFGIIKLETIDSCSHDDALRSFNVTTACEMDGEILSHSTYCLLYTSDAADE